MRLLLPCVASLALVCPACVLEDVSFEGKACPCDDGWHCVDDVCRRDAEDAGDDAGSMDGGRDAGGALDAGADAGTRDAGDGGGASDAGSDAGPGDAGTDAGILDPTECDDGHPDAIFCDGFEELAFASWDGTFSRDGYTGRSTTQTFQGLGALYAETSAASGQAAVRSAAIGTVTSGDLYMRVWVYVPSDFTVVNISLFQAGQNAAPYHHFSVGIGADATTSLFINSDGGSEFLSGASLPLDEWVCLEAHVVLSDTAGVAEYWMNDTRQARVEGFDSLPVGGYVRHVVGLPYTGAAQTEARAYFDEVVVDDARIGCD